MTDSISKWIALIASINFILPSVSAIGNGLYFTCYNSQGWCEAECSLPCYFIDSCNGFRFMFACPSTFLLFLIVLACIVVLSAFIFCTTICCCKCYGVAKEAKIKEQIIHNESIFSKDIVRPPIHYQRPNHNHHISVNAFDDFPSTQVNVTPAPRVSVDTNSSSGWSMNFLQPSFLNEDTSPAKKTFALHYN